MPCGYQAARSAYPVNVAATRFLRRFSPEASVIAAASPMIFTGSYQASDQATAMPGGHAAAQLLKFGSSQVRALSSVDRQVGTDKSSVLSCAPS
jgi:hypothetical protein